MAENEDADDLAIIFRSAGKPVRMSSAAKWRRAITLGDLTRETPVEVETGGRSLGVRPAGEVAALARLFDEISPQTSAAEPDPAVEDVPAPLADAAAPAAAVVGDAAYEAPKPPSPPPPFTPRPAPPAPKPPTKTAQPGGCLGAIAVIIILAVVVARGCSHHHTSTPSADSQTVYVTRQVNLRPQPSSGNSPLGALDRGSALAGIWNDADKTWFKVTTGDYQGDFVWGMDLAGRPRPDLAVTLNAAQVTQRAVTEYREPDSTSPSERDVAAGESLAVVGKLASGWWEVTNKGKIASTVAGVGYAPPETFDAPAAPTASPASTEAVPAGLSVSGCDQSSRPIAVAYAFQPKAGGPAWTYKGWMRLAPGECKLLFVTNNADFYLRGETADDGASLEWAGTVRRCVSYPGPYEYDLELGGTCPSGSRTAGFFRRTPSNASGTYTENFK